MDMLMLAAATVLRHGLNFSTGWCTMRLISVEKDWKHVLMQKVVTLNTRCDVAFITAMYVHHLSLYCILFRRFLITKINVALQLTKL